MRGGERLDFDDTGEVSRETQQELGSKVLGVLNNEPERRKADTAEMAALNEAVFEHVDILGILEKTTKVAEKMDPKVLLGLREDVRRNPKVGAEMTKSRAA